MFETIATYEGILKLGDIKTLVDIETVLVEIGYTDHQLEASEVEMIGNLSHLDKALTVTAVYEKHVDAILLMMGVHLMDDETYVNLRVKADILTAMFAIEDPSNFDILSEAIANSAAEEDTDVLIEVLNALTEKQSPYYEMRIDEVDLALIDKIKKLSLDEEASVEISERTGLIKTELRNAGCTEDSVIYAKIVSVNQLPLAWATTYTTFHNIDAKAPAHTVAQEAIFAVIAAGIEKEERLDVARKLIDDAKGDFPIYPSIVSAFSHLSGELFND